LNNYVQEARRRWPKAWIAGVGPIACLVSYVKHSTVSLFTTKRDANKYQCTLNSIQEAKRRWTQTEIIDLFDSRAQGARLRKPGQRN
jgi:hypothetical protein